MGIVIGIILIIVCITGIAFVYFSPQFGRKVSLQQKNTYALLTNYKDGKFINPEKISMKVNTKTLMAMMKEMLNPDPNVSPRNDVIVAKISKEILNGSADSTCQIFWLGHSSFLIRLDGKTILIDPVFSKKTGPHTWVGRKKYNSQMPIDLHLIPHVDAVLISHDHYDHLDYESIVKLKNNTDWFFVPLGVGNHLKSWKVNSNKILEMNWWEESSLDGIQIAFTPSRHMSGRGFTDQSATLWGSWVINGLDKKIYFSGDGGYGKHFKEIGHKYGPFDIGLMECGQYNKLWANVHMMPEESVQAGVDVCAKKIMPIHWGSYRLATHDWLEPVERFTKKAKEVNVQTITPKIGEKVKLDHLVILSNQWWKTNSLSGQYIYQ